MKKIIAIAAFAALISSAFAVDKITLTDKKGKEKTFDTVSAALKAAKGGSKITLPKGVYEECLYYSGSGDITISGDTDSQYGSDVVIRFANNGGLLKNKSSDNKAIKNRCLFEVEGSVNLTLENLTLENSAQRGRDGTKDTQAEALGWDSTGNIAAYNCSFKSHQDTMRTIGKAWFYRCYIEGDVDFIWMERTGKVALYEECEIKSVFDENASNHNAYVCAPRMEMLPTATKGIVILNSKISSAEGNKTYLARTPWKEGYYNQVAYIGCSFEGIDDDVWYKEPIAVKKAERTTVGWKMDKASAENLGLSLEGRNDIVSDEVVSKEYNGRKAILNRTISVSKATYKKEGKIWDTDALATSHNWTVSPDNSSVE